MKKLIAMLMAGVLCLSLVACGGGADKQPAIDAFNTTNTAFTELENKVNANLDLYPQETIDGLAIVSEALAEKKALLESDEALTEEDVTALVSAFQELDVLIADTLAAADALEDAAIKDPAIQAFNSANDVFNALANDINANTANYPDDIIAAVQEMGEALSMTKELLESDQVLTEDQVAALVEQMNTNEAWLNEVVGLFMNQTGTASDKAAVMEYFASLYTRYDALVAIITEDPSQYTDEFLDEVVIMAEGFEAYAQDLDTDEDIPGEALSRIVTELSDMELWIAAVEQELLG